MTAFEEMGIMPELGKALEEMEWLLPTNIQAEAMPLILGGGDVLMAAETGSGKTGAFCLPVLQVVWETLNAKPTKTSQDSDKWLLSAYDRGENLSLNVGQLSAQSKGNQWQGVRANKGVRKCRSKKNRFYYEAHFTQPGLARVGWALENSSLELGLDQFSWGYGGTAKKSNAKDFVDYGEKFGEQHDVVGNIIDLDEGTISWTKNGKDLGVAYRLPSRIVEQNAIFPCVCIKNAGLTVKFIDPDVPAPFDCQWLGNLIKDQFVSNSCSPSQQSGSDNNPKAIILEPSRELAEQTHQCLTKFKKYLPGTIRQCLLVGGIAAKEQINQLQTGVDIVTGTIGRVNELINSGHISLRSCRFFIIDEVDAFLAQGNTQMIMQMHSKIPRMFSDGRRLQMIVCSATLHNFEVKKLAQNLMFFPTWVDLKGEDSVPETVHHVVVRVDPRKDSTWKQLQQHITTDGVHHNDRASSNQSEEGLSEAIKILKGEYVLKAIEAFKMDCAIIFCRTKLDCDNLESYLEQQPKGYRCVCLHSDRTPQERTSNLQAFKDKQANFLICTDVAARGIDISGIPYLIQMTLPDDKANYLHRIGRVGRAERMGLAISFVSNVLEKVWFHANCRNRGKNCNNTRLVEQGGCCIWYNELQLLADIEEHLNCIITEMGLDFQLEVNQFDGKVVYGDKERTGAGYVYKDHVAEMKQDVETLCNLEANAQLNYLSLYMKC